MRVTLNFSGYIVIYAYTHPCDTFTHSLTRILLLQLEIHIWMELFWNQKFSHLRIKEISTLKTYINYFNKNVCWYKLIF